ncbi:replication factor RFC1 C terminal domain-containing protein [Delphinella strobiligena]|nr:replication factor RFC1 C terminal domain-containing protein [Delphinella strobiligena]
MPPDIRSFFGGKPAATASQDKKQEKPVPKKTRGRKVVEDSDPEEEPQPKKVASKPQSAKSPQGEETTSADYFGSKSKPKRSEPIRPKPAAKIPPADTPKKVNTSVKKETPSRVSTRNKPTTTYAEDLDEDDFPDDDLDGADQVFAAEYKRPGRDQGDAPADEDDSDQDDVVIRKKPAGRGNQAKLKEDDYNPDDDVDMKDTNPDDDFVVPDDDERMVEDKPAAKTKAKAGTKRKAKTIVDEDDDEESDEAPKKKAKKPAAKKAKKEEVHDSAEMKALLDVIPLVKAPTPPPKDSETRKFKFGGPHPNSAPPPEAGNMEIPEGADNCLAGLTFVFTGVLRFIGREEGQQLVKRYGGKVTTAPSKNTSYVVLGDDAGPKKLEVIAKNNIKTINEEGLFKLIKTMPPNGGDSKAAAKYAETKAKEDAKIREMAAEMEEQERAATAAAARVANAKGKSKTAPSSAPVAKDGPDNRLWTVKYAPSSLTQICGNKGQVDKLENWLKNFSKNHKTGFKMPGKDGSGTYRAVMIHGPPGIGKTTAAHLVAKLQGYDVVESNASDTRSKKLVETGLKGVLSTTSLLGYFSGDGKKVDAEKKKMVLIMDEVDGMSAGDRGGVGALAAVCKKTQIPMILICNDRKLPKMKPFDFVTYDLPFRRPTAENIRSRISTITFREGLKIPPNVINALIEGSGADIRQVINMVSTAKLDQEAMDFDQGKEMSKSWEKHTILKPWDITSKILGGGMFASSSKATLNDKVELYFNDHEFSPLMLQENYLGTNPILSNNASNPREKNLKHLDLACKAAESISDGDLVDRMIHGSQQQWSLMPAHAVFSFVRPASFVSGSMAGHHTRFTAWLGQNSSQGKLSRMVKEIQGHMRLRTTGDRHEIRQQYLPILWQNLVKKLQVEGKEAVPEIIELMDSYFLTKDDFDAIMELGVGSVDMENVKIETQAKSTFTRLYNAQSHPLPFMKASNVQAPQKATRDKPDLEEAIQDDDDDDAEVVDPKEEGKDEEDDMDITKDKYVAKPKKKKAAAKPAAKGKSKAKKATARDEDDEESEEDFKPKKGRGKAATTKAKAKK